MEDFLWDLHIALRDQLPANKVDEQIENYKNYFKTEQESGKTMEQILAKLGDPKKVAQMILDHYHAEQEKSAKLWVQDMYTEQSEEEINNSIQNPEHGVKATFSQEKGWDIRLGRLKLNSWYGTLIVLGIVLGIFLLLSLIFPQMRV